MCRDKGYLLYNVGRGNIMEVLTAFLVMRCLDFCKLQLSHSNRQSDKDDCLHSEEESLIAHTLCSRIPSANFQEAENILCICPHFPDIQEFYIKYDEDGGVRPL